MNNKQKKTILITGACGCIGKNIANKLEKNNKINLKLTDNKNLNIYDNRSKVDIKLIDKLKDKYRKRIYTTDENLSEIAKLNYWNNTDSFIYENINIS